jgi:pyridinium-3,5-biscarboxylic acid mononucleotide sulfurtransferase
LIQEKLKHLNKIFSEMESVVVAYSGGIDSTFLLKVAYDCLGDKSIGATAVSPSVPKAEIEEAKILAGEIGVKHVLLESYEMEDSNYTANTENRCYFCKTNAYDEILKFAETENIQFVLDGTNADDIDDFRPGRKAAKEKGVRSPLQETGFSKADIRELAKELGLPNWDKPAAACLSSRIPYGTPVTEENLSQVEQAEIVLKNMGFEQLRVRHHDKVARIEVELADFERIINQRENVVQSLKSIGYKYITLDLSGFRSGSMNEVLQENG